MVSSSFVTSWLHRAGRLPLLGVAGIVISAAVATPDAGSPRAVASAPAIQLSRAITFNKQIAPILFEHCAECHRPNQAAPFSLLTYEDARAHATQIADVTKRRYMPPWKPAPGGAEFVAVSHTQPRCCACLSQSYSPTEKVGCVSRL